MDTDNKRTYDLRGGSKESNARTGGRARTEPSIAGENSGPCGGGGNNGPEGGSGRCVARDYEGITPWKEYHHQRLNLFTIVDMNAPVWQIPYAMGPP